MLNVDLLNSLFLGVPHLLVLLSLGPNLIISMRTETNTVPRTKCFINFLILVLFITLNMRQ